MFSSILPIFNIFQMQKSSYLLLFWNNNKPLKLSSRRYAANLFCVHVARMRSPSVCDISSLKSDSLSRSANLLRFFCNTQKEGPLCVRIDDMWAIGLCVPVKTCVGFSSIRSPTRKNSFQCINGSLGQAQKILDLNGPVEVKRNWPNYHY